MRNRLLVPLTDAEEEFYRDWKGKKMESPLFRVDAVINGIGISPALLDSGSGPYAIVNPSFVRKFNCSTFRISPRSLGGVGGETLVTEIYHFSLDLDGHKQHRIYAYVVARCPQPLILGLPWIQSEEAEYQHKEDVYWIGSSRTTL